MQACLREAAEEIGQLLCDGEEGLSAARPGPRAGRSTQGSAVALSDPEGEELGCEDPERLRSELRILRENAEFDRATVAASRREAQLLGAELARLSEQVATERAEAGSRSQELERLRVELERARVAAEALRRDADANVSAEMARRVAAESEAGRSRREAERLAQALDHEQEERRRQAAEAAARAEAAGQAACAAQRRLNELAEEVEQLRGEADRRLPAEDFQRAIARCAELEERVAALQRESAALRASSIAALGGQATPAARPAAVAVDVGVQSEEGGEDGGNGPSCQAGWGGDVDELRHAMEEMLDQLSATQVRAVG
jgi:DNA repair exonuclease SbcCD ATPase subunit